MIRFNYVVLTSILFITSYTFGNNYIIESSSGIIKGYVNNNVVHWDDIPYAEPPIGDLRWKAPRELNPSSKEKFIEPDSRMSKGVKRFTSQGLYSRISTPNSCCRSLLLSGV